MQFCLFRQPHPIETSYCQKKNGRDRNNDRRSPRRTPRFISKFIPEHLQKENGKKFDIFAAHTREKDGENHQHVQAIVKFLEEN